MSILISKDTKILVQGITGRQGSFHTRLMLQYGAKILAGVTPGKAGAHVDGVSVYNSVGDAIEERQVDASILFVPAYAARDAALEAIEARIHLLVIITERIPVRDSMDIIARARKAGSMIIGPNTPGIIVPNECKIGIMPAHVFKKGNVGIISRSGTLTYEVAAQLSAKGYGQSTCIGIGGDPCIGLDFVEVLKMFRGDGGTKAIVLIGEIGGNSEERAANYIKDTAYPKPVVAYVAGRTAPQGKKMGHAGAIILGKAGTAENKNREFEAVGVGVAKIPSEIPKILAEMM
jgi:succinyl-CoA synthetase alpha subunit